MSVRIRLSRRGTKKAPLYFIVAADQRAKRDGKFLEKLGTYNPHDKVEGIKVDLEATKRWISVGAVPSETATRLLKKSGLEIGAK